MIFTAGWLQRLLLGGDMVLHFGGKGDSPPPAPAPVDPSVQIGAQARAMPSIYGPTGSRVFSGDPNVAGSFKQTETLSPEQQQLYEGRTGVAQSLLNRSGTSLKGLPVNYEWQGADDPTTNRMFTESQKLLDKTFASDEENLDQKLSNQGLPQGSEAYDEQFSDFRDSKADAYQRAAASSLQAGSSQSLGERQQKLNEVAQALGGSQLTPVGQGGAPIDVNSAYAQQQAAKNAQYQGQLAGYNADVNSSNSMMSGLFGLGAAKLISDRRLKRDIVLIGEVMPGINWFAFNYIWDAYNAPKRFGLMADEVALVMPDAVIYDSEGFAAVDYGKVLYGRTIH